MNAARKPDDDRKMTSDQSARLDKAAKKSGKEEAKDDTLSEEGAEQRIDMLKGQKPNDAPKRGS